MDGGRNNGKTTTGEIRTLGLITAGASTAEKIAVELGVDAGEVAAILRRLVRRDLVNWKRQADGEIWYTVK